jgi:hypothetical protein
MTRSQLRSVLVIQESISNYNKLEISGKQYEFRLIFYHRKTWVINRINLFIVERINAKDNNKT